MERWNKVNDKYLVSDIGRVRSIDRIVNSKNNSKKRAKGIILIQSEAKSTGYLTVNTGKSCLVHRLVAIAFIPNPENKRCVNHKDGDKKNNHYSNLEWCTYSENTIHSYNIGSQISLKGVDHSNAKLDDISISIIREAYSLRIGNQRQIAEYFGVSQQTISSIINKKLWTHLN